MKKGLKMCLITKCEKVFLLFKLACTEKTKGTWVNGPVRKWSKKRCDRVYNCNNKVSVKLQSSFFH